MTTWNAAATRIFGYEADEMIGASITWIIPDELRQEEEAILAQLRRGERIDHFETVRVAKDGRPLDMSLTISPCATGPASSSVPPRSRATSLSASATRNSNNSCPIASQSLRRARSPEEFVASFNGRVRSLATTTTG